MHAIYSDLSLNALSILVIPKGTNHVYSSETFLFTPIR
jgi:hypothetical protein